MKNFFLLCLCLKSSLSPYKKCEKKYNFFFQALQVKFLGSNFEEAIFESLKGFY